MSKWREVRLGQVAPFKYGKSKVAKDRMEGKYKVFSSAGECGFSDDILANKGIIVGRKGSIGKVYFSNDPFFCIDTAFYIDEVEKSTDLKFIYYYLPMLQLENYNNDAAVPGLNRNLAHNIKIKIPDLETQEKIAQVLSSYDELIENNNRRIELLENMAEEIYKEWFVRMRFPGHEEVSFEKGIPEGWELKKIGDIVNIRSGYAFKSKWWQETGIPVIKIKDIVNGTVNVNELSYVDYKHIEKASEFKVGAGDLLIAMTGATIGKIGLVPYYRGYRYMLVNQRVGKFFLGGDSVRKVPYLYFYFKQESSQNIIRSISNSSSAQPNISGENLENMKILYNDSIIDNFNMKISKNIKLMLKLNKQNQNLIKQRDMLLPRLMNGTIEVE